MNIPHTPVLLNEIIDIFNPVSGAVIDCTLGYGGHSEAILKANKDINIIANDQDDEALLFSRQRLEPFKDRVSFVKGRFSDILNKIEDTSKIKGILADIGVSSLQLDKNDRGFGFDSDVLDMRMDRSQTLSAKEVINEYPLLELERIFKEYGEIREYKKLAINILKQRKQKKFTTAKELASFVAKILPKSKLHPATLAFQAIRIEVNNELSEIKELLESIKQSNIKNAYIAIISFHSLEDRIVKNAFKDMAKSCICSSDAYRCECGNNHSKGKIITKKPILANKEEIKQNPRARSAKLRVFQLKEEAK